MQWDTAGQERFRAITMAYYRACQAILVVSRHSVSENAALWKCNQTFVGGLLQVYSIANRESFASLVDHVNETQR